MGIIKPWRFVGRPRRWCLKTRPGQVPRARRCSQPVLFWRMIQFGVGSEITITSQETFTVRDFQRLPHQNGSERERRHQKEQEAQCLLPPLCWLHVIIPRLPPQNLGASGPFLTLPTVLGKVVTSSGQQIRYTGSDRQAVTKSAGNSVISEPHPRPPLPTNN